MLVSVVVEPTQSLVYLYTYISHENQPNVGKYTKHGLYGNWEIMIWLIWSSKWLARWWLNQPMNEIYARQFGSFPQVGWKLKIFETTTQLDICMSRDTSLVKPKDKSKIWWKHLPQIRTWEYWISKNPWINKSKKTIRTSKNVWIHLTNWLTQTSSQ